MHRDINQHANQAANTFCISIRTCENNQSSLWNRCDKVSHSCSVTTQSHHPVLLNSWNMMIFTTNEHQHLSTWCRAKRLGHPHIRNTNAPLLVFFSFSSAVSVHCDLCRARIDSCSQRLGTGKKATLNHNAKEARAHKTYTCSAQPAAVVHVCF